MSIKSVKAAVSIVTLAVGAASFAVAIHAQAGGAQAPQGPPPQRIAVTTTVLKPGSVPAYREVIQNETVPMFKKAGVPWRWVFSNGPFGPAGTYVTVSPVANFAQFDQGPVPLRILGPEGAAKYNAKLQPNIESSHTMIQGLIANASIQSFSSTPPTWIRVSNMMLVPGKGQEFASITAQEFLPALKKAGVTDYWVFNTQYGGPVGLRTIVTTFSKFADLDQPGPIVRALGAEAAQKLNQKRGATVASTENTVYRYVPELSYGVPAKPTTSTQQ